MRSGARAAGSSIADETSPRGAGLDGDRGRKDLVRPAQAGRGSALVNACASRRECCRCKLSCRPPERSKNRGRHEYPSRCGLASTGRNRASRARQSRGDTRVCVGARSGPTTRKRRSSLHDLCTALILVDRTAPVRLDQAEVEERRLLIAPMHRQGWKSVRVESRWGLWKIDPTPAMPPEDRAPPAPFVRGRPMCRRTGVRRHRTSSGWSNGPSGSESFWGSSPAR